MRVALVTTPPSETSIVGEFTRALLPHLRQHCEVDEFVERGREGVGWCGGATQPADRLRVRDFDQVLYQVGNEAAHAFMLPMLHVVGGTVAQHDWQLIRLAVAARPALLRGGLRGAWAALGEGGVREARAYSALSKTRVRTESRNGFVAALECAQLTLNRSVVRHADAFLVDTREMKTWILLERNTATPVAIVQGMAAARSRVEGFGDFAHGSVQREDSWPLVARQIAEHLAAFPPPRSRRKSLIQAAIAASQRVPDGELG